MPDPTALPTGSSGKLTPAQRARLGLDAFGDDQLPTPEPAPGAQPAAAPDENATTFDFAAMDPAVAQDPPQTPHLKPAQDAPRLAPVNSNRPTAAVRPATAAAQSREREQRDPGSKAESRLRSEATTVKDRDGMPEVERDRSLLGYGAAWTIFCIVVAIVVSAANITSNPDMGPTPGAFVPAVISIILGWMVVAIGYRVKAWGWLMIIPAVVLLLGPFVYTNWKIGQTETTARALLSSQGAKAEIDIDATSILSSTVNTDAGCFAMIKDRSSGDLRVDVVTYAPATAQQQATMALSPRFARRVPAGGTRVAGRTFSMAGGKLPVVVVDQSAPPIDCAKTTGP
jgi:hypothetical protein